MKNFRMFINELQNVETIEELESGADLFQFGVDKNYYSKIQAKEFNNTYWSIKNKINDEIICSELYKENMSTNYMQTLTIIRKAPATVKADKKELKQYINRVLKALKNEKVA